MRWKELRYGDVKGLGNVYKKDGSIILKENEKQLTRFWGKIDQIFDTSSGKYSYIDRSFLPGKCEVVITNRRIIFLRKPYSRASLFARPYTRLAEVHAYYQKHEALKKHNKEYREFVEVPLDELGSIDLFRINSILWSENWQIFLSYKTAKRILNELKNAKIGKWRKVWRIIETRWMREDLKSG
jgi:hypothetical protein